MIAAHQQVEREALDELVRAADLLSEAAVEIDNLAGPGNVVSARCRQWMRDLVVKCDSWKGKLEEK